MTKDLTIKRVFFKCEKSPLLFEVKYQHMYSLSIRFSWCWRYLAEIIAPPEIEDASEIVCGAIRYIPHARAAKFSLYLHYSRACAVRCIYSRGAFAGIQATWRPGLISEVSRDLGISMRALFPRERRHCFAISPAKGQDTGGRRIHISRPEKQEEFLRVRQKSRRPGASDTFAAR